MEIMSASEARIRFSHMLSRASRGERIIITHRGTPVAVLGPVASVPRQSPEQLLETVREFRRGRRLEGVDIRELIEDGRE